MKHFSHVHKSCQSLTNPRFPGFTGSCLDVSVIPQVGVVARSRAAHTGARGKVKAKLVKLDVLRGGEVGEVGHGTAVLTTRLTAALATQVQPLHGVNGHLLTITWRGKEQELR